MTTTEKPPLLADRLAHARSVSAELNLSTNRLNAALLQVQGMFSELRLGVHAHISLTNADDGEHDRWRELHFEKEGSEWRLAIVHGFVPDTEETTYTTPLLKTSRSWRLDAAREMPRLLEALIKGVESELEEVEKAVTIVDAVSVAIAAARR